jgi:hypothetical protein
LDALDGQSPPSKGLRLVIAADAALRVNSV